VHLPGDLEDGLEADAFLADVALSAELGALSNAADGSQVPFVKAIFVAVDNNLIIVDTESDVGLLAVRFGPLKAVIVGIL